jgi:hypothetical protein
MNKSLVGRLLFAAAFVVLVAVNSLVLSGVADNQAEAPVARLWMTERELPKVKWLAMENSGVDLHIRWRNLGREENGVDDGSPSWLSGKKLEELGFTFANGLPLGDRRAKPALDREVFLVLEFSGPAHLEAIRRAERALVSLEEEQRRTPGEKYGQSDRFQAKKRIRAEESERSRLFVVDAGLDPGNLRQLYDDPARYLITSGVIGLHYHQENGRLWARGTIRGVRPAKLNVPLQQRRQLDRLLQQNHRDSTASNLPRYEVEVVYGQRFEPWINTIRALEQ